MASMRYGVNVGDGERFLSGMGGGALLLYGLAMKGALGTALSTLGGALVARGATGRCAVYRAVRFEPCALRIEESVTVARPREELYLFFGDVTNFARFMLGLSQVTVLGGGRSRWVARGKRGAPPEWDVEIVLQIENERIVWRTVDPEGVKRSGVVCFRAAPGERGTEVTVILDVAPAGGLFAGRATRLRCEASELMVRGDLRRWKQLMEAGEIPTTVGQPSGRKGE